MIEWKDPKVELPDENEEYIIIYTEYHQIFVASYISEENIFQVQIGYKSFDSYKLSSVVAWAFFNEPDMHKKRIRKNDGTSRNRD